MFEGNRVITISAFLFVSIFYSEIIAANPSQNVMEKWVARYDYTDPALGEVDFAFNIAWDLAVDGDGNVIMAGYEHFWNDDIAGKRQRWSVVSYDSKGRQQWVRRYSDPAGGWAQSRVINTDGSGGAYVSDYKHIVRYSSEGEVIWEQDISDIGIPEMINVRGWGAHPQTDGDNNYIFALSVATDWVPASWNPDVLIPGLYDVHVVKFDKRDGEVTLLTSYAGSAGGDDEAWDLYIDDNGYLYVTGYTSTESTGQDLLILKLDPEGNLQWAETFNNALFNGDDTGNQIAVDSSHGVYVTGRMTREIQGYRSDMVTLKYSQDGDRLWQATHTAPDIWMGAGTNLALDNAHGVYTLGLALRFDTWFDSELVKYDSDTGEELWAKSYASPSFDEPPEGNGLLVDVPGNVYIATSWNNAFYVEKSDPDGNLLWNMVYDHPDSIVDMAMAITLDEYGNVYVSGTENRIDPDVPPGLGPQPDVAVTIKYKQMHYQDDDQRGD